MRVGIVDGTDYCTHRLEMVAGTDSEDNTELNVSLRQPVEKFYFLSVQRVSYGREAVLNASFVNPPGASSNVPTHRLVVQDLRAAWTKSNRQVAFALYDSWVKAQVLSTIFMLQAGNYQGAKE